MFCKYIIILVVFGGITNAAEFEHDAIADLVGHLHKEQPVSSILLVQPEDVDCSLEMIAHVLNLPLVSIKERKQFVLKEVYNSEILALVCSRNTSFEKVKLLQILAENFQGIRGNRIVLLVDQVDINIFKTCVELNLFSVIALLPDFSITQQYFTYKPFPKLQVVQKKFHKKACLFQNQYKNLMGKQLLLDVVPMLPRIIFDDNQGIIALLMRNYAEIYNLTLNIYLNDNEKYLAERIHNSIIDMAITFKIYNPQTDDISNTNILFLGKYVVILPLDKPIRKNQLLFYTFYSKDILFAHIFSIFICALIAIVEQGYLGGIAKTLQVYLRLELFRGLFGYSIYFNKRSRYLLRFIYLIIIINGLFNVTIISANLSLKLTIRPKESSISSFDELLERGYPKILTCYSSEQLFYSNISKYAPLLKKSNSCDHQLIENIFVDTEYAYNIFSEFWKYFDDIQNRYDIKLHRREMNMRYNSSSALILGFVFPDGSPFKKSMELFVLRVFEAGLPYIWHLKVSPVLYKKDTSLEKLNLKDYQYIFSLYVFANILSGLVLLMEICYKKYSQEKT